MCVCVRADIQSGLDIFRFLKLHDIIFMDRERPKREEKEIREQERIEFSSEKIVLMESS